MEPFKNIASRAIPLSRDNVDTDLVFPGRYLSTVTRTGLGKFAFESLRFDDDGTPDPDCVFNQPGYERAEILLAGANFGCGSSREHAVWAIGDLGIRCIIAKSFGDTFYFNCLANGLLAVALDEKEVDRLIESAADGEMVVDLDEQFVRGPHGHEYSFDIDAFHKNCLLKGLDAIDLTLEEEDLISAFEKRQKRELPWLYAAADRETEAELSPSSIILHHEEATAGALRITKILALKKAAWRSARLARPEEAPGSLGKFLTGAMGQPVLQKGHHFWVSDLAIIDALEEFFPEPTLFPNGNRGMPLALLWWSDQFAAQDGDGRQLAAYAALIKRQLADGRAFLQGSDPGLADVNAYAGLQVALMRFEKRKTIQSVAGIDQSTLQEDPVLMAWYERVESLGSGAYDRIRPRDAWQQARCDGESTDRENAVTLTWLQRREERSVSLDGLLHEADENRILIRLANRDGGPVTVHFPAIDYRLETRASKGQP